MSSPHEGLELRSASTSFLNLPPSCVRVSPFDPTLVVIGTYKLESGPDQEDADTPSAQQRSGSLVTYRLSKDLKM